MKQLPAGSHFAFIKGHAIIVEDKVCFLCKLLTFQPHESQWNAKETNKAFAHLIMTSMPAQGNGQVWMGCMKKWRGANRKRADKSAVICINLSREVRQEAGGSVGARAVN